MLTQDIKDKSALKINNMQAINIFEMIIYYLFV